MSDYLSEQLIFFLSQMSHTLVILMYLQMIKYGVVGMPALQQDLQHWSHLYVAGRLHKPVAVLTSQPAADAAYQRNLRAALSTALLLMSQQESSFKVSLAEQQWEQHAAALAVLGLM